MANLFYRDVKYLFEIVITVWMFATSVVYPVERVGGRLGALLALNPMTPLIEAFRDVLIRGSASRARAVLVMATVSAIFLAGALGSRSTAPSSTFAENL